MINAFCKDRHFYDTWLDADINKWWAEQKEETPCLRQKNSLRAKRQKEERAVGSTENNIAYLGSEVKK